MGTHALTLDTVRDVIESIDASLSLSEEPGSLPSTLPSTMPSTVPLGPFQVADTTQEETVAHLVDLAVTTARHRAVLGFALHVGGLNALKDTAFVDAMNAADMVYADGGAVVWLGRRAGALRMGRAPTTDIGWDVLRGLAERLGRLPRVAFIGGGPGLAKRAAATLEDAGVAEPVLIAHGYHEEWAEHVDRVRQARPDVILVGLGAPNEMKWAHEWAPQLGQGLILTCGGWFGFLAGEERRAPRLIRRPGLEWMARVAQQPWRLGPRYARGAMTTATLTLRASRSLDLRRR
jgi:N-acetylglucosaminyldiphosphoundecaprenol N-acetyl-beta-D-mannosaminyltransferase